MISADGRPAVKLSDNPMKAMGPPAELARYRRVFQVGEQAPLPVAVWVPSGARYPRFCSAGRRFNEMRVNPSYSHRQLSGASPLDATAGASRKGGGIAAGGRWRGRVSRC